MDNISFYDVRKREKVDVPVSSCWKVVYERPTKAGGVQKRYAVRANVDGSNLTKFVKEEVWNELSCPEKSE